MAVITKQAIVRTGLTATYGAAAAADQFVPGDRTFIHIKNGSGVDVEATFTTPKTVSGIAIDDPVIDVTAGQERFIGPFPSNLFGDPADGGLCSVAYETLTTVTVAVFDLS